MKNGKYDVIIVGGGPAGLTAGIYASRAGLKTLLLERALLGGQAVLTDRIENYPGFPEGINGAELIMLFEKQARRFGVTVLTKEVKKVESLEVGFNVITSSDNIETLSLIAAAGSMPRKLGVKGEVEFTGRGVSYCATCDAPFFRDMTVAVAGGGDAAVEEALFLTKFASKVYLIHRRDRLRATALIRDRAEKNPKIEFVWNSTVTGIYGDSKVEGIKISNVNSGEESDLTCSGIFVFIGYLPATAAFKDIVDMDEKGYIKTDRNMMSSKAGIFACGDCVSKTLFQVVTACGDGAQAAFSAGKYVENLKGEAYE